MPKVIDEHSRQCPASHVQRQWKADGALAVLADLLLKARPTGHIVSDI